VHYPLSMSFKIVALAPQLSVTTPDGAVRFYVKQKLFKLKEAVTVFADTAQSQALYTIKADRVIDFSARYQFTAANGQPVGAIKRQGMRSLWKAHYEIFDGDIPVLTIREANPWTKVLDALLGEIPIVGMFTGYLFHPAYVVSRPDGTVVLRAKKQPAFFESKFTIEQEAELRAQEETQALLGLIMILLLERSRG
jgi:uncharacterized protein YxjI